MLTRFLFTAAFVSGCAYGQIASQLTSTYQTLFTSAAFAGGPRITSLESAGRVSHLVSVQFQSRVASACIPLAVGQLEYSFDSQTYVPFGQPLVTSGAEALNVAWAGTGAYPFVRFNLISFNTSCTATGYYVGSNANAAAAPANCNLSGTTVAASSRPLWAVVATNGNASTSVKACSVLVSSNSATNSTIMLYQSPHASNCLDLGSPGLTGTINLSPTAPTVTWAAGSGLLFSLRGGYDLCASATGLSAGATTTITVAYLTN